MKLKNYRFQYVGWVRFFCEAKKRNPTFNNIVEVGLRY